MSSSIKYAPTKSTGGGRAPKRLLATKPRAHYEAPKGESGSEAEVNEPAAKSDKDNDADVNASPPASTGKCAVFPPRKKSPATESEGAEPGGESTSTVERVPGSPQYPRSAALPATSGGGKRPKKRLATKSRAQSNASDGEPDVQGDAGQLAIGTGDHPNISADHPYASAYSIGRPPPVVSWYRTQDWNAETEDD
ncbi:hypothetical protein FRC11_014260 [Ceratobasidium sp. 423]|nr:hypothetical protein FRC11_014260 [Ceratobasidium sp. 423]